MSKWHAFCIRLGIETGREFYKRYGTKAIPMLINPPKNMNKLTVKAARRTWAKCVLRNGVY
jgi:hypothetical protein